MRFGKVNDHRFIRKHNEIIGKESVIIGSIVAYECGHSVEKSD